jgi:hypothetical protein
MQSPSKHRRSRSLVDEFQGLSLDERVVALEEALRQKEGQVQQAAQFGRKLVQDLELANQRLASAQGLLEEKQAECDHVRAEHEDDRLARVQLEERLKLSDLRAKSAQEECRVADSGAKQLQVAMDEYEERVGTLSEQNVRLERENESIKRRLNDAEARCRQLGDEVEQGKQRVVESEHAMMELNRAHAKLLQERQAQREAELARSAEIGAIERAAASDVGPLRGQVAAQRAELKELHAHIDALTLANEEMRQDRAKLREGIDAMARENRNLYKERDENLHFLNEARSSIAALIAEQRAGASSSSSSSSSADSGGAEHGSSLLGELEKELSSRLRDEDDTGGKTKEAAGGFQDAEEYFLWLTQAIKIATVNKYPHQSDRACQLTPRALYKEVGEAEIAFHEWHTWLEQRIASELTDAPIPRSYRPTPLPGSLQRSRAAHAAEQQQQQQQHGASRARASSQSSTAKTAAARTATRQSSQSAVQRQQKRRVPAATATANVKK